MKNSNAFTIGAIAASVLHKVPSSTSYLKGVDEGISFSPSYGEEDPRRQLCKAAALAFINADKAHYPEAIVFAKMANSSEWNTALNPYFDVMSRVFGEVELAQRKIKAAAGPLSTTAAVGAAAGLGKHITPWLAAVPAAALGGGSVLGALWWLANSEAFDDADAIAKLKSKRNFVNSLTDEIHNELEYKGLVGAQSKSGPVSSSKKKALQDLNSATL